MNKSILASLALIFSSLSYAGASTYSCDIYRYIKNGPTQKDIVTASFPLSSDPKEANVYVLSHTQSQLVFFKSEQVGLFIDKDPVESYFQVLAPGVFPAIFNIASGDSSAGLLVRANCTLNNR